MAQHLRNLTLASAKHIASQGHITPQHHARIVVSVTHGAAAAKEMRGMEAQAKRRKPPAVRGFGSLAQQAQAPIPGSGAVPEGTATGYE